MLSKYMPALDGLRATAILMVILTHAGSGWQAAISMYQTGDHTLAATILPPWGQLITSGGSQGVQLFFLISAFTLTCRAQPHLGSLSAYALRRVSRIAPGYWIAAAFYTFVTGLSPRLFMPDGQGSVQFMPEAFWSHSWHKGGIIGHAPGGWSIECEAIFYCALPVVLYLIDGRIGRALILAAVTTFWAVMWVKRLVLNGGMTFADYTTPLLQAPVFLYGIAAALIIKKFDHLRLPYMAIALLAFAIFLWPLTAISDYYFPHHLSFSLLAIISVALAAVSPPRILANRMMRRIGEVSYSMYLIHFIILAPSFRLALYVLPSNDWRTVMFHFAFTTLLSFLMACLTFKFIEHPIILWAHSQSLRLQFHAMKRVNSEISFLK